VPFCTPLFLNFYKGLNLFKFRNTIGILVPLVVHPNNFLGFQYFFIPGVFKLHREIFSPVGLGPNFWDKYSKVPKVSKIIG